MTDEKVLETVLEHHTDMLLVEELKCEPEFAEWFAGRCGVAPEPVTFARNSVWDSERESDVMVIYGDSPGCAVLIENKVTALLSLGQTEDYHRRGAELVVQRRCGAFRTCILAPEAWFSVNPDHGFHAAVTYEEVAGALLRDTTDRARWRASVFQQGAARAKRKLAISNEQVAQFLNEYYRFAQGDFPDLATSRSTGQKTLTITFPLSLRKELGLVRWLDVQHQVRQHVVLIAITSADVISVTAVLGDLVVANGWRIVQNSRRVDIVADAPVIDLDKPIEEQAVSVRLGLTIARNMLNFIRTHAQLFKSLPIVPGPEV